MLENVKSKRNLHLARKIFHLLSLLGILMCMMFLPQNICWIIYFVIGLPLLSMDYFRRFSPGFNRFALKIVGPVIRKHELRKLSGGSFAIISVGISFLIFPKPICLLAILFLAIGDPSASFFGLLYGRRKLVGDKSLIGSLAAFVVCSLGAYLFFNVWHLSIGVQTTGGLIILSLACGLAGSLSELISIFGLDDNLTQPLVSGALLSILFWLLGGMVYV